MLRSLTELAIFATAGIVVASILTTFVAQLFYIPTGSMLNTLQLGDRVVVTKPFLNPDTPSVGDIVVINVDYVQANGNPLIKRVVGTSGDTLEYRNDILYRNSQAVTETWVYTTTPVPDFGPITVEAGHMFLMGDHRDSSSDSRVFGTVPETAIVGYGRFIVWPISNIGGI